VSPLAATVVGLKSPFHNDPPSLVVRIDSTGSGCDPPPAQRTNFGR